MLPVLAQRAASEGPRWTRAVESTPVARTTCGLLAQPDQPYAGTLIKSGKAGRTPIRPGRTLSLNNLTATEGLT
jgi:hypothetical protein